jgi:phage replication O-like protein O
MGADDDFHFDGFDGPTYTQVPDAIFDVLMAVLSGSEFKVLLYIVRRTFGFKKLEDDISLNQIIGGIKTKDGRMLDRGTGLSRDSVTKAIRSLEEKGIIVRGRRFSEEKGDQPTTYALRFKQGVELYSSPESDFRTPPPREIGRPPVRKSDPQETVVQQTEEQETVSNFEISNGPDPSTKSRRSLDELAKADEEWNRLQARVKRQGGWDKM